MFHITSKEEAEGQVQFAFVTANGLILHAIDYAAPYISSHSVKSYVDGPSFQSAISSLANGVRSEVISKINDAMSGFNTRVQNASIDYNSSIPSEEDAIAFSEYIKTYSDKLSLVANDIVSQVDQMVSLHATNRPLLRATGNREVGNIVLDGITTIRYEFTNVGSLTWTGWMVVKVSDQYKKSVTVDFAPANIPVISPGETAMLSREIKIDKIHYVNGNPRTWGNKSKIVISIYTRGV